MRVFWMTVAMALFVLSPPASATDAPRLAAAALLADPRAVTGEFELNGVRSVTGGTVSLQLTPFTVWTPDARVVVVGADGVEREQPIPQTAFFRGHIQGDPASRVYLSVEPDGTSTGLVRHALGALQSLVAAPTPDGLALTLTAVDMDAMAAGRPAFQCQQDRLPAVPPEAYANGLPQQTPIEPIANPAPDGALFRARLAIDSDWEFRQRFASSAAATSYIGNLVGYASTIYTDQLDTQLEVSFSRVFDSSADPYTQTASDCALYEFGKHWNDNFAGTSRTIAHLVSGKGSGGGVAWVGVLCNGAFNVDTTGAGCPAGGPTGTANYGGAYGFTGEMTGSFNPAAPTAVWDIVAFAHEVGHNFNSPHTHCYGGIGGNGSPVDSCFGQESGTGCSSAANSLPGSAGQSSGTIMSYCHLLSPGMSNVGLTLGGTAASPHPFGTAPLRVPSRMRDHVAARATSFPGCLALGSASGTLSVTGPTLLPGASGTATVQLGGSAISGAQFRLCVDGTRLSLGSATIPTGLAGLGCAAQTAGSCPAGTTVGITCSGFAPGADWTLPQSLTVAVTAAAGAPAGATPLAFASGATFSDPGGNDFTPTATNGTATIAATYTVGGTISGLAATRSVVLRNTVTGENLTRSANGSYTFAAVQGSGALYTVTVQTQPVGQNCSVAGASGTIGSANVTNVNVSCVDSAASLVASSPSLARGASGNATVQLGGPGVAGATFRVCVDGSRLTPGTATIPAGLPGLACTVTSTGCPAGTTTGWACNGLAPSGTWTLPQTITLPLTAAAGATLGATPLNFASGPVMVDGNGNTLTVGATNGTVTITGTLSVGGTLSGLAAGQSVTLRNTVTSENLTRSANGGFTFATPQANGASYSVIVQTQPAGQSCSVTGGSGTLAGTDVSNIIVSCAAAGQTLSISAPAVAPGGTSTASVVLTGAGVAGAQFRLCVDGTRVTIGTPTVPAGLPGLGCVAQSAGNCPAGTTVGINCAGFAPTGTWTLPQTLSVPLTAAAGAPLGSTPLTFTGVSFADNNGGDLPVTVTGSSLSIATVQTYIVGGTISGLAASRSLVLRNAVTGESLTRSANGAYTFATAQTAGASYNVTVQTQPTGQTCTVANGTGTIGSANVTNVDVSCAALAVFTATPAAGSTLDVGPVVFDESREVSVQLANTVAAGGMPLSVSNCSLNGNPAYSRVDGLSFPQTVQPGASITVRVRLSSVATLINPLTGTLNCMHDAGGGSTAVSWPLTGRAVPQQVFANGFEG